ncbi:hypothetical protein [Natronosalvus halobius]|uniref:hypothetical protein n=1 Tax=Natronosalvus halobius TaxID=2953746 RepID=UPI0020A0250A|nr:hypothetical protein [Natronosalvus halobius]USZ73053.1 hypothetical protein NGM15_07050 [Natronosalvus halobius]
MDGEPPAEAGDETEAVGEAGDADGPSDVSDAKSTPVDASNAEATVRSAISDELGVPETSPDPETSSHVLPDEKLAYPVFAFESGSMDEDGGFDLEQALDRESMRAWLEDLSSGLASHDVGVSTPTDRAIFGVGAGDVSMRFDPDDNHTGTLEVTFSVKAKLMTFSDDPGEREAGARGGEGFIPLEMLTSEKRPEHFRCYNWIDDPIDR